MQTKENKFKAGDIVNLRSGSPYMTVGEFIEGKGAYECHWFSNDIHHRIELIEECIILTGSVHSN